MAQATENVTMRKNPSPKKMVIEFINGIIAENLDAEKWLKSLKKTRFEVF